MTLKVQQYDHHRDVHRCTDDAGAIHYIDLLVDGGLGRVKPESLIGMTVECDELQPYLELAVNVRLKEEP